MKIRSLGAVGAGLLFTLAPAAYANTCQADHSTCSTSMPPGGYCECFSHGETDSGTVVARVMARHHVRRASHPDCTANPSAPGCS